MSVEAKPIENMGFDYTKIKFFIRQKLVNKYTIRAHFPWRVLWRYFASRHLLIFMCQPNAHWLFKQWVLFVSVVGMFEYQTKCLQTSNIAVFFTASKHISAVRVDYACTLSAIWKWSLPSLWSYLPWWLWPRPTKQVWITYTVVSTAFSRLKN